MQSNIYTPEQKKQLDALRAKLDGYDDDIILLLKKRFEIVKEIGEFKKQNNLAVYDPHREEQILNRLHTICKKQNIPLSLQNIKDLFLEIFSISRALEAKQKIAYLGPQGTFCEQKALQMFGSCSQLLPINSIGGVFKEIESDKVALGLVPLENSLGGMVSDTIYALYRHDIFIISCNNMAISHSLCTNAKELKDIKKIYSKDIAFLQCSDFLDNYSDIKAQLITTNSTAKAIELARQDEQCAAICLKSSARRQGVKVLYEDIQNKSENITKFITLSKSSSFSKDNTMVAMIVKMQNKSGALVKFLNSFSSANIDLDKIESHTINGELIFYIQAKCNPYNKELLSIIEKENNNSKGAIKLVGSW